jgi:hypothetical protein
MDAVTIGLVIVVIALILAGWAIGHFGTSRRRRMAPTDTATASTTAASSKNQS